MHSTNQLVFELNRRNVPFLTGGESNQTETHIPPAELLAGLIRQPEARLRLAVIPLLLVQPHLSGFIVAAFPFLSERQQLTLQLFYTAAMLLQQLHADRLRLLVGPYDPLPDLFSDQLGLRPGGDPASRLKRLGHRHRLLSGRIVNWSGTYHHAADRLLKQLTLEAKWSR